MTKKQMVLDPKGIPRLKEYPPFLIYALARERHGSRWERISLAKISADSGLPTRTVTRLTNRMDWRGVKCEVIEAFLKGCRVDPWRMNRHLTFLQKHINRIPYMLDHQWKLFNRRCAQIAKTR